MNFTKCVFTLLSIGLALPLCATLDLNQYRSMKKEYELKREAFKKHLKQAKSPSIESVLAKLEDAKQSFSSLSDSYLKDAELYVNQLKLKKLAYIDSAYLKNQASALVTLERMALRQQKYLLKKAERANKAQLKVSQRGKNKEPRAIMQVKNKRKESRATRRVKNKERELAQRSRKVDFELAQLEKKIELKKKREKLRAKRAELRFAGRSKGKKGRKAKKLELSIAVNTQAKIKKLPARRKNTRKLAKISQAVDVRDISEVTSLTGLAGSIDKKIHVFKTAVDREKKIAYRIKADLRRLNLVKNRVSGMLKNAKKYTAQSEFRFSKVADSYNRVMQEHGQQMGQMQKVIDHLKQASDIKYLQGLEEKVAGLEGALQKREQDITERNQRIASLRQSLDVVSQEAVELKNQVVVQHIDFLESGLHMLPH